MSNPPTFATLAQKYEDIIANYNSFEKDFINRVFLISQSSNLQTITSWKKQKISDIESDIDGFTRYLQLFSDLYKQIFILASHSDPGGNRKQYLEGITVIINSIQYIYLTRLSQVLNDRNNVKNFRWAIFSIVLGIISTVISLAAPYYLPDETGDKIDQLHRKLEIQERQMKTDQKKSKPLETKTPTATSAKVTQQKRG